METTASLKKQQVKEKIGAAAMQCFARFGLDKTTLDDIARAVNLNKASLYYYYKNKEDIFLDVALREGAQHIAALQQKAESKKGIEKQVLFYLQERIVYYKQVLNMHKIGAETLHRILPTFFKLYQNILKQETLFIARLLKESVKAGTLKNGDMDKLAAALISISDALKHQQEQQAALLSLDTVDYNPAIQQLKLLVQLALNGLKKA
jgi:AcrR family transcriptional regulator